MLEQGQTTTLTATAGKYLTFKLGAEEYGLEILKVQEIIGLMRITTVPNMPPYLRGVINLRGKVIPVVNLRSKFQLEGEVATSKSCIIVVQVKQQGGNRTLGVTVDEVCEVQNIGSEQLEPPPALGGGRETDFMLGMGKIGPKVVMLLDIDRVLGFSEIAVPA